MMSREVSFHACLRRSFNSKTVDSQSLPSEKGVILILSCFRSMSGSAWVVLPVGLGDLDLGMVVTCCLVGVSTLREFLHEPLLSPVITNLLCQDP